VPSCADAGDRRRQRDAAHSPRIPPSGAHHSLRLFWVRLRWGALGHRSGLVNTEEDFALLENLRKWIMSTPGKRLPMLQPPLRVAGEGVDERLTDALFNVFMPVGIAVGMLPVLVFDLLRGCWGRPTRYWLICGVMSVAVWLIACVLLLVVAKMHVGRVRSCRLGLLAERLVGQQLERCRASGCSVFHDIVDDKEKFNIDHLVIGMGGVFVVETKGKSKPEKGETNVWFDGQELKFSDGSYASAPIRQVKANAAWVRKLLSRLLADKKNPVCQFTRERQIPIKPAIVYPGWYVDFDKSRPSDFYLTNEKLLLQYIRRRCQDGGACSEQTGSPGVGRPSRRASAGTEAIPDRDLGSDWVNSVTSMLSGHCQVGPGVPREWRCRVTALGAERDLTWPQRGSRQYRASAGTVHPPSPTGYGRTGRPALTVTLCRAP